MGKVSVSVSGPKILESPIPAGSSSAHSDTLKFVGTLSDFFSEASYGKMHKTRKVFDFLRNFKNQIFLSLGTFLKILGSPFLG